MNPQEAIDYTIYLSMVCGLETSYIIQSLSIKGMDSEMIGNVITSARAVIGGKS